MHDTPNFEEGNHQMRSTINISNPGKENLRHYLTNVKNTAVKALQNRYITTYSLITKTHIPLNPFQVENKNPQYEQDLKNFTVDKTTDILDLKAQKDKGKERYTAEESEEKRENEENKVANIVINKKEANDPEKQVINLENSKIVYCCENDHEFMGKKCRAGGGTKPSDEDFNINDIDSIENRVDGDCWFIKPLKHESQDPKDDIKMSAIKKVFLSRIKKSSSVSLPNETIYDETKVLNKSASRDNEAFQSDYKHKKLRKEEYARKHQFKRKQKDCFQELDKNKLSQCSDKNQTSEKSKVKDMSLVFSKVQTTNLKDSYDDKSNVGKVKRVHLNDYSHQFSIEKTKHDEHSKKRLKYCPVNKTYDQCKSKRITGNELETRLKGSNKYNETNSKLTQRSEMKISEHKQCYKPQRVINSHSPSQITQCLTENEITRLKSQPNKIHTIHAFDGSIKNDLREQYNQLNPTKETLAWSSKNTEINVKNKNDKSSRRAISSNCNTTADSVIKTKALHNPDKKTYSDNNKSLRKLEHEPVSSKTQVNSSSKCSSRRNSSSSAKLPDTKTVLSTKRKNFTDEIWNPDNSLLRSSKQEGVRKKCKLDPTMPQIAGISYHNGLCNTTTGHVRTLSAILGSSGSLDGKIPVVVMKDVKTSGKWKWMNVKRRKKEELNLEVRSLKTKSTTHVLSKIYQDTHITSKLPCKVKEKSCTASTSAETLKQSSLKLITSKAYLSETGEPPPERTELLATNNITNNKDTNKVKYSKTFENESDKKPSLKVSINLSAFNNEIIYSDANSMKRKNYEEQTFVPNSNNISIIANREGDTTDKIKDSETLCSQSTKYLIDTSGPKTNIEDMKVCIEKGNAFQCCCKTNIVRRNDNNMCSIGVHRNRPHSKITAKHCCKKQKVILPSIIGKLKCNRAYFFFLPKNYKGKNNTGATKASKANKKWKKIDKKSGHDNETCNFKVRSSSEKYEINREVPIASQQNLSQQSLEQEGIHNIKNNNEKQHFTNAEREEKQIVGFERQVIEALEKHSRRDGASLHDTLKVDELCDVNDDKFVLKSRSWLDPSAQVNGFKECTMKYQNSMQYLDQTNKNVAFKISNSKRKTNMSLLKPNPHFHDDNCIKTKTCHEEFGLINPFVKVNMSANKKVKNGNESYIKQNVFESDKYVNNHLKDIEQPPSSASVFKTIKYFTLKNPFIEPLSNNIFDTYKSMKYLENYDSKFTNEDFFVNPLSTKQLNVEHLNSTLNYFLHPPNQKTNETTSILVQNGMFSDTHLKQKSNVTSLFSEEKGSSSTKPGLKLKRTEETSNTDDINQHTYNDACTSKLMVNDSPTSVNNVNIITKGESVTQSIPDNTKLTNNGIFFKGLRDKVSDISDRKEKMFSKECIEKESLESWSFQETNCMDNKTTSSKYKDECSENDDDMQIVFSNIVKYYCCQGDSEQTTASLNSKELL